MDKNKPANNSNDEVSNEQTKTHKPARETDLPDNQHDIERMQPEEATIDLPDVSEIPGQEHIHVPQFREMQDVTIASDDEEGVGLFGEEDDALLADDINDKLSSRQEFMMGKMDAASDDDARLQMTELDDTDTDGTPLNEGGMASDVSGGDLDTSGVDEDDAMEDIGEEDEENNFYSLGGDNNENLDESKE